MCYKFTGLPVSLGGGMGLHFLVKVCRGSTQAPEDWSRA